jgi:hypothetical protein
MAVTIANPVGLHTIVGTSFLTESSHIPHLPVKIKYNWFGIRGFGNPEWTVVTSGEVKDAPELRIEVINKRLSEEMFTNPVRAS